MDVMIIEWIKLPNEQWMGYPVGPHYSESSNIDNADRLKGRLLLIVGEMDNISSRIYTEACGCFDQSK